MTINALKNGQIDAADIFTTDPSIQADKFVVLQDPKNLYLAQNVLPLIDKSKATPGVTKALDAVSAKLTTDDLVNLNEQVITEKKDPKAVATAWLASKGLTTKGTEAAGVSLTVGSANFQENVILANIYAAALTDQGAKVSTKLNIGSRETYIPALEQGSIDLIPEYTGVLLQYFDKNATAQTSDEVFAALTEGRTGQAHRAAAVGRRGQGRHRGDRRHRQEVRPDHHRRSGEEEVTADRGSARRSATRPGRTAGTGPVTSMPPAGQRGGGPGRRWAPEAWRMS